MLLSQRNLFDIPEDVAYFNCAYNSPQLIESQKRLLEGVVEKNHPWKRTASDFFENSETIRISASEIFGGDPDGFAVIPAASYGISTAARIIEPLLNCGDKILIMAEEFPGNVLPWRRIAKERNADIVTVQLSESENWTDAIINQMNERVKVVALSHCHWTNGAFIDLLKIRDMCNKTGSILVVDATQSLGAMPLSIEQINPDFLVAAGYKWLLCPYGFGILYVSKDWRESRPLEESWLTRHNAEDFTALVNYSDEYMPGARRFDVGEKCTPTILPGAIAAFEQIKRWGIPQIAEYVSVINNRIASHLSESGFQIPPSSQRAPHMFGAIIPDSYRGNLVAELREHKIYISQRGRSIRFAPHLFITENDIKRLLETIDFLLKR